MKILTHTSLILLIFFSGSAIAQSGIRDSSLKFTFGTVGYTLFKPGGDLDNRFGTVSMIGGELLFKRKSNLFFGVSGGLLFGDKVKEPGLLSLISTSNGQVIGIDGLYADVRIFMRGYYANLTMGKIFSFGKPNPNSGIVLMGGPGFVQHKIRFENVSNSTPQLDGDYLKGYDHLSNGISMREFVGWIYFGNKQLLNFVAGFEFIQGFTENRRDYNFDTPGVSEGKRTDLLWGLKLGWMIPFYKKRPDSFYFY